MNSDKPVIINEIECYAVNLISENDDYPYEVFKKINELEASHFWYKGRLKSIRNLIIKYVSLGTKAKFLEIGGGTGATSAFLKSQIDGSYTVSEVSLEAILNAKRRYPSNNYVQLDARNIPYQNKFNIIGIFDVIEHLEEEKQVMDEIYKALEKSGYILISVPQYNWLWSNHDELSGHKRRYTRKQLCDLLASSGFEVIKVTSYLTAAFPLMLIARLFRGRKKVIQNNNFSEASGMEVPSLLNRFLGILTNLDASLIRLGISLPFGGSLIVVGKKIETS